MRRLGIGGLCLIVAGGLSGWLGPQTRTISATENGYTLTVTYPAVTRPGLPIRLEFEIRHPGGFPGPVTLSTTFDYVHLFDISNLEPEPSSSTATADRLAYTFDRPSGDAFRVSLDGNTEPNPHEVPSVTTSVIVAGQSVVAVDYRTSVVP
jgi:hypothetical protein